MASDTIGKRPTQAATLAARKYLLNKLGGRKVICGELLLVRENTPDIWREIVTELALEFDIFGTLVAQYEGDARVTAEIEAKPDLRWKYEEER